jgi:biopolymer transport protein ExbD
MSKGIKKFITTEEENTDMSLQITSMADIFVIILVFLLKSFSTGLATISPSQGVTLPSISTQNEVQIKEAAKLEILQNAVLLDQKPIIKYSDFEIPVDLSNPSNTVSNEILNALLAERKKGGSDNKDSHLIVLADEKAPYSAIKTVMASAANSGYVDLQLVVIKAE